MVCEPGAHTIWYLVQIEFVSFFKGDLSLLPLVSRNRAGTSTYESNFQEMVFKGSVESFFGLCDDFGKGCGIFCRREEIEARAGCRMCSRLSESTSSRNFSLSSKASRG